MVGISCPRSVLPTRRPSISLVVAALALFVALGGPAEAQRLLSGSDIEKGTITSKQVKDRSLAAADLSAQGPRRLTRTPAGSITDAKLGDGAVTARSLAPASVLSTAVADAALTADDLAADAVGTEELGDNAVGQAEIRNNGVGASEITNDSIDGGEIIDGGLLARDVALLQRHAGGALPRLRAARLRHREGHGHGGGHRERRHLRRPRPRLGRRELAREPQLPRARRRGRGQGQVLPHRLQRDRDTVATPDVAFFRYAVIGDLEHRLPDAAVDRPGGPGDPRRALRAQEGDHVGHLPGLADPPERHARRLARELLLDRRAVAARELVGEPALRPPQLRAHGPRARRR